MAVNIGPKIGIEGEAEYRKQLNNIITQTKTLHAETKALESSFTAETSAQEKAAKQMEQLTKAIDVQQKEVAELEKGLEAARKEFGENDNRTLKWRQALANAKTELNELNKKLDQTPKKIQALGLDMQAAGAKISATGKKISSVGSSLTKTVTAPVAAASVLMVKTAADFDASMSKVAAVSGAYGEELAALSDKAREMGATTKYSASEAADAMNYMAMAGWKTEEMISGIEGIMSLAAASGEDLATTSDIVTDALTAFGKSAQDAGRLADVMAAASSNANTNVSMMGETFKLAAPVAGALGFSMEDTALVTGLMANAGIKASNAGTAMRRGFSNLVKPTKQVQTAMDKYGISLTNADGSMKDLRTLVKDLRKNLGGLDEAEQAAAASAIFGTNAFSAWLAVINGSEKDFDKLADAIDGSAGVAEDMAKTMQDNLSGQLTILKSQLQELAISFGTAIMPTVRKAVTAVQGFVDKLNSMDEKTRDNVIRFAALAAAAGPVVLGIGKLTTGIGSVVTIAGKLTTAIGGLSASLGLLPVALAVGAAVGLGVAFKKLAQNAGLATPAASEFGHAMAESVKDTEAARQSLVNASVDITTAVADAGQSLRDVSSAAILAKQYGDELAVLADKGELSNEEFKKAKDLISKLKEIYPDFTAEIDEQTKSIKTSTKEIKEQIKALEKQAKTQAMQDVIAEIQGKIVEAEKKRIEAEMEIDKLTQKSADSNEYYTQVLKAQEKQAQDLIDAEEDYNEALRKHGEGSDQAYLAYERLSKLEGQRTQGLVELNGEIIDASEAMTAYNQAGGDAENQIRKTNEAISEAEAASAAATEELESLNKQAEQLGLDVETLGVAEDAATESTEALTAGMADLGEAAEDTATDIDEATAQLIESYNKAYESAYSSTMGQSGLFEELETKEATSIANMNKGLESHITALTNWNTNAQTLMESERYATDETFRAMVNSIIEAGDSMAPELDAITQAFASGDETLETLVDNYGNMQQLASDQANYLAQAEIAAEYGLDAIQQLYEDGTIPESAAVMVKETNEAMAGLNTQEAVDEIMAPIEAANANTGAAKEAAKAYADSFGQGVESGDTKAETIEADFKDAEKVVSRQQDAASMAGRKVTTAYGSGVQQGTTSVKQALRNLETAVKEKIEGINPDAKTEGEKVGTELAKGIRANKEDVKTAAGELATSASSQISGIGDAAKTWGIHLGQNFAAGISSTKQTAINAATEVAQAVASVLKHSTPERGPLKNDDVWGYHLAQNFAAGMRKGEMLVEAASVSLAERATLTPGETVDPYFIAGGGSGLDAGAIYAAIRAGAEAAETSIVIGEREFARILRSAGVAIA